MLLSSISCYKAQTSLVPGDILFTSYNGISVAGVAPDTFSFVILTPITSNTVIYFTERGFQGAGVWQGGGTTEGTISWTSGTALSIGQEVVIAGIGAGAATVNGVPNGNVAIVAGGNVSTGLSLSNAGDQVIAFQGGAGDPTSGSATMISGISWALNCGTTTDGGWNGFGCTYGPQTSKIPPSLTGGTNAFLAGVAMATSNNSHGFFNCAGTPYSTVPAIKAALMNKANWTMSTSSTTVLNIPGGCNYYATCTNPTINTQPSNSTICLNGNSTFTIAATGATAFQWQLNTGSGFNNITNGGVYANATTATLNITGVTTGMNGYLYRCIATDGACSTSSSQATLTVSNPSLTALSQTTVSCFGGSNGAASVNAASGGISPYSYNWTPGNPTGDGTTSVTGLTAGTWTCTVTDANSCIASTNFTITQPTAITLTAASQTNVSCNGGSNGAAQVNPASGGAGGFTYNWTPGNPTGDGTTSVTGLTAGSWTCTVTDANGCTNATNFTITQPTIITANISSTSTSCTINNGTATVSAIAGGSGGYTYDWTPGTPTGDGTTSISGLSVGTWTCTITDANGCQITRNTNVTTTSAPSLTAASQTNVSCNGGSNGAASVNTATGGAGGYTYNWTPGNPIGDGTISVTGLTAGTWTCTVTDAGGCSSSVNFTITHPTAITLTALSQTNVTCNGGSNGAAHVNPASGGAGGYTYNWTPGNPTGDGTASVTGLTAGTWTCTVTDANSCTASTNFTITQPTTLSLTVASQTNVSCNGGSNGAASVNVATGGAGGYTYNWTPGNPTGDGTTSVTGLIAGTWTCTVTDANACATSVFVTITEPTAIILTAISQTNVACNGGSDGAASVNNAIGGSGSYTYDWSPGNPTGDGTASVTGLTAGTWTCTATDLSGCVGTVNFTITQPSTVINAPLTSGITVCQGENSAIVNATATTSNTTTQSITIAIDVVAQPFELSSTSLPTSVSGSPNIFGTGNMPALPIGAMVTGATFNYNGIQAISNSLQSDVRLGLTGSINQNWTAGTGALNSTGTFNYLSTISPTDVNSAGGIISLHYFDFSNNNGGAESTFPTGIGVATITVNYTVPVNASITWWDAPTAGNQIGSGFPFETVGTSVIPNTNTPGSYTVYAQAENGGCTNSNRTAAIVNVNANSSSTTTVTSCSSYTWTNGNTYSVSGIYIQNLTNVAGCDSIVTLELTITQPTSSVVNETACSSYFWAANSTTYTMSGIYNVSLSGANTVGCDSTITLNLTINQPSSSFETITACDSYLWSVDGQTYTNSGTYTGTLTNSEGCDSLITLNLTINNSTSTTIIASACDSYLWSENGQQYTSSGIYSVTYSTSNGCDSIINLDLTIYNSTTQSETVVECESYTWNQTGITYMVSGIYLDTMASVGGCDSIFVLDLTITGFPSAIATNNGDATISASSGATYQWFDCSTNLPIAVAISQTFAPSVNGNYAVIVTNASGCSDTSSCVLINNVGIEGNTHLNLTVIPNPTKDKVTLTFDANLASVIIRDAQGKLIQTSIINSGEVIDLGTYQAGLYFFEISTNNGNSIERIIKE
ncbi:MAG: beta strand repeat-containing protein [Fluviicola sp.]